MVLRVTLALMFVAGGVLAALAGIHPAAIVVAGAGGLLAFAGARVSR